MAAVVVLLGALVVGQGALSVLLGWGLEIALSPAGALAFAGLLATAVGAAWLSLRKLVGLPAARAGLVFDARFMQELPLAALVGVAWAGFTVLGLSVTGLATLARSTELPHVAMVLSGFLASVLAAAFRQLSHNSLLVALAGDRPINPALLGVPSVVTSALLVLSGAPWLAVGNGALLALVTALLFAREDRREHAIAIGFEAGWLFTLVFVAGSPILGLPHELGLFRWPGAAAGALDIVTGGPRGFDGGLACTAALTLLTAALVKARFAPVETPGGPPPIPPPP